MADEPEWVAGDVAGAADKPPPPANVDPDTGEVLPDPPLPGQLGLKLARQSINPLMSPLQVYHALEAETRKLALVGERIAEVGRELHGYYNDNGDYVAGLDFEYAAIYDQVCREIWADHTDTDRKKDDRPRWPGEDVREALAASHPNMDQDIRKRRMALRGELKSLDNYLRVVEARISAMQTLMGYHRDTARLAGTQGSGGSNL